MGRWELLAVTAYGTVLFFNIIVFALSANLVHLFNGLNSDINALNGALQNELGSNDLDGFGFDGFSTLGDTNNFAPFALSVSVITFIVLVPVVFMNLTRKHAATSLVVVHLGVTFFLGVFWLAAAANTASVSLLVSDCNAADEETSVLQGLGPAFGSPGDASSGLQSAFQALSNFPLGSVCSQTQAVEAFSWLNWLILHALFAPLVLLTIVALTRSNKVLMRPLDCADFLARPSQSPDTLAVPMQFTSNGEKMQTPRGQLPYNHYQQPQQYPLQQV